MAPTATTLDIDGPVHHTRYAPAGPGTGTIVLVHGLGASRLSWRPLAERLAVDHTVVVPDLVGFGDTEPLGRPSTVGANHRLLVRMLEQVAEEPVVLVGNSMGGMVSAMATAARPDLVSHLVLLNPALPASGLAGLRHLDPRVALMFALYNLPVVRQRFMRWRRTGLEPRRAVELLLDVVCADASRVDADLVTDLVDQVAARRDYAWSDAAFLEAQRSLLAVVTSGRSRYTRTLTRLPRPTLLLHGDADGLVPVTGARRLAEQAPDITYVEMADVGHAPQLEVPELVDSHIRDWLDRRTHA